MIKTTQCKHCGKTITWNSAGRHPRVYCSSDCSTKGRHGKQNCRMCGKKLNTNQTSFCSIKCFTQCKYIKRRDTQRIKWGKMIDDFGGKCSECGNSDKRVLDFNHKDPRKKIKGKLSDKNMWGRLRNYPKEKGNLEILCANCHRVRTWKWHQAKILKPNGK